MTAKPITSHNEALRSDAEAAIDDANRRMLGRRRGREVGKPDVGKEEVFAMACA
jgi:hypothetical protein